MVSRAVEAIIAHNTERRRHALSELRWHGELMGLSERHAAEMARRSKCFHSSHRYAENVAKGQASGSEVVKTWMSSRNHKANIVNARHGWIGCGVALANDGQLCWCVMFS